MEGLYTYNININPDFKQSHETENEVKKIIEENRINNMTSKPKSKF